jgi:hypothetical protein
MFKQIATCRHEAAGHESQGNKVVLNKVRGKCKENNGICNHVIFTAKIAAHATTS